MTTHEWQAGYNERIDYALEGLGYVEPSNEWLTGSQARAINEESKYTE